MFKKFLKMVLIVSFLRTLLILLVMAAGTYIFDFNSITAKWWAIAFFSTWVILAAAFLSKPIPANLAQKYKIEDGKMIDILINLWVVERDSRQ